MKSQSVNHDFPLKDQGLSNALSSTSLPRHRWYFVKEAFAPGVVERAIADAGCGPSDTVVDPFCGSGTVPLTASLNGFRSVGIEVNPFLSFVSRTKLLQAKASRVDDALTVTVAGARKGAPSALETFSTFSEAGGRSKYLFNTEVLRAFEGGWAATDDLSPRIQQLSRLALLASGMDTCNATRDGKCLRYRKTWRSSKFTADDFLTSLETRIKEIKTDLSRCPNKQSLANVRTRDSRTSLGRGRPGQFRLCVTSPPYLNSFDYTDIYRPELFLGKFVRSMEELRALRQATIRSHVQASWKKPHSDDFGPLYKQAAKSITERAELLWDARIPSMVQAYFEDMRQVLLGLRRQASPDASVWLVVSTSAYAGVDVPVDLIIADIGARAGWFLRDVGVLRHLRTSSHHWSNWEGPDDQSPCLRESVVIFDARRKAKQKRKAAPCGEPVILGSSNTALA